ncbi:MAG: type II toxin-antitoxin system Phd/YefM family antitoxin [Elusimicrobia bacterium]|nr:type II toxin-antitoxin system Phd/YefM family antitoxin [Elusimicrobiota bacterium]
MAKTVSLKELRPNLPKIMANVDQKFDRYIVTKRGRPLAVILSTDDYEGLLETIEILQAPACLRRISRAKKEMRAGKVRSLEEIHRSLDRV